MPFSHEDKHESLWIKNYVKAYCTIHILRQKYIDCPLELIRGKRNGNKVTYDAF